MERYAPYQRLTWDPIGPAPFESAWSVFYKLMALNHAPPGHVAQVIANGLSIPQLEPLELNYRDSSWIDFNRFAYALKTDQSRLRACFLDQFGFPLVRHSESVGIRHCPDCLSQGYHCVFFQLAIVSHCPWHKCLLMSPCTGCDYALLSGLSMPEELSSKKNSPRSDEEGQNCVYSELEYFRSRCKHLRFNPKKLTLVNDLSEIEQRRIVRWCRRLLNWWRRLIISSPNGMALWRELTVLVSSPEGVGEELALRLGSAERIAGQFPWPTRLKAQPTTWMQWDQEDAESVVVRGSVSFDSDLGRIYRSIRRHLFRRFVRSHLCCWKCVTAMDRTEAQCLSTDLMCSVSIAYAVWRMAIQGFTDVADFRRDHSSHKPYVFMMPSISQSTSIRTVAHCWYVAFFGIWAKIELLGARRSFVLEKNRWELNFEELPLAWSFQEESDGVTPSDKTLDSKIIKTHWVLYPDIKKIRQFCDVRCYSRPSGKDAMIDTRAWNNTACWWSFDEQDRPRCLFLIRNYSFQTPKSFVYINL